MNMSPNIQLHVQNCYGLEKEIKLIIRKIIIP